jgi:hypothetical protein
MPLASMPTRCRSPQAAFPRPFTGIRFAVDLLYLSSPGRVWLLPGIGYFSSSAKARITIAVTNRQSMAIVIRTRIQDDFSSNRLTSFALARPAGRSDGLRTDGSLLRADLPPPLPNTQKKLDQSTAAPPPGRRLPSQFIEVAANAAFRAVRHAASHSLRIPIRRERDAHRPASAAEAGHCSLTCRQASAKVARCRNPDPCKQR